MHNEIANELNQVLKGEHMAVEFYENFIHNVDDGEIKDEFRKIQQDHMKHVETLTGRIQELGGKAKHETGFAGYMADIMNEMKARRMDSAEILEKAYKGENNGLSMIEELVKGDLDENSRAMIVEMRSEDKKHLESMKNLMEKKSIQH